MSTLSYLYLRCAGPLLGFLERSLYPGRFPSWQVHCPLVSGLPAGWKDSVGGQALLELPAREWTVSLCVYTCLSMPFGLPDVGLPQDGLPPLSLALALVKWAALCLYLPGADPPRTGCLSPALSGAGPLRDCYPLPAPIP